MGKAGDGRMGGLVIAGVVLGLIALMIALPVYLEHRKERAEGAEKTRKEMYAELRSLAWEAESEHDRASGTGATLADQADYKQTLERIDRAVEKAVGMGIRRNNARAVVRSERRSWRQRTGRQSRE